MSRPAFEYSLRLMACCALAALPAAAAAQAPSFSPLGNLQVSRGQPVMLEAQRLDYDNVNQLVIAEGKVEVSQGQTIVLADTLTYDQRNNIVFAQGHVSVLEPSGNVYFAEEVEFARDLTEGVIKHLRARLSDNSLFAANEGIRRSEDITELSHAVYSPCAVQCADGTEKTPLWQVRAESAVIDRQAQDITYRNAYMDFYGVPVLYSPYFAHAMPGSDNRSGLLTPEYRHDANLGNVVTIPAYWAIGPSQDATATLIYPSLEAPVLSGEYRRRWDSGDMRLAGSLTRPNDRDALGNVQSGNTTRGHFFGDGSFALSDSWQWGFNLRRTTDDTYLRRYDFNNEALLTSRIYGEGFNPVGDTGRSYIIAQALAFQGLQQQDDARRSPLLLPTVDMFYQSRPMAWNSRVSLTGGVMSLTRDLGADSHRLSLAGEWAVPYVTEGGHVFELSSLLRADGYSIDHYTLAGGRNFNGTQTRLIPQLALNWRYPLITRLEGASLVVEPIANFIASPVGNNPQKIPNEDSAVPEFTDTNLFSSNRFAGYDRVETGPRINYGARSQLQFQDDHYIYALLGQAYRTNNDPLFPISNDLTSRFSDYVGRVGFARAPFDINYRFRADKDNYSFKRNELEASLNFKRLGIAANYLDLTGDPVLGNREELAAFTSVSLSEHWVWNTGAQRDMLRDNLTGLTTGLAYHNECVTLNTTLGKNYTSDRDFRQSTSVTMQLLLKNLN